MNPNEHRKSFESAADIKHRRRTTKSQFQTLETTFQSEFLLKIGEEEEVEWTRKRRRKIGNSGSVPAL